jgi:hypothetical protein
LKSRLPVSLFFLISTFLHSDRLSHAGARDYTVSLVRPFARRALITLRPAFVAILDKNPWTRLRRLTLG